MSWRGAALALAVWGVAAGLTAVGVTASAPVASAAPCASAAATASMDVAVVVDFGDGSPVSAVCVPAQSSDNGAAVLAARAQALGTAAPRFDSSGFVCGIDGYPATGCGEQTGSTYAYWSYWHGDHSSDGSGGSSAWDYSNVGAGGSRIHSDVVEGWRFQPHGAGNPSDPPPNGSPDAASTCAPPSSPTTSTSVEDTSTTSVQVSPPTTSSTVATSTVPTTAPSTSTITTTAAARSSSQVAAGPVRVTERSAGSHSSPWPAIATGGAIVALGAGGMVVARRRRTTLRQ